MSVQTGRDVVVECQLEECSTAKKKWEMHHGKFCSSECEHKHDGRQALAEWKFSHTRCFTCFTQLKEIEPPKPDEAFDETGTGWTWDPEEEWFTLERFDQTESREAAVGFQHRTPGAETGEKNVKEKVTTGTICRCCGNTDHTLHVPYLVETHPTAVQAIEYLEGDHDLNAGTLHRVYARTGDLELAAGRALR